MMDISAQTSYSDVERWCNDFAYQFIMGQEAETLANIACVDSRNDYCIDLFKLSVHGRTLAVLPYIQGCISTGKSAIRATAMSRVNWQRNTEEERNRKS